MLLHTFLSYKGVFKKNKDRFVKKKMSKTSQEAVRKLYDSQCTQLVISRTQCPSTTNGTCMRYMLRNPGPECSNYMATTLRSSQLDRSVFDSDTLDYCLRKYDANGRTKIPKECECLLRNEDPDYRKAILEAGVQSLSKEADQCWYLPCRDARKQVMSTDMLDAENYRNVRLGTDVCTGVTCSQLVDARGSKIGIAFIDQKTGCASQVKKTSSSKDEEEGGQSQSQSQPPTEESVSRQERLRLARERLKQHFLADPQILKKWIIGVGIIFLILLLLYIFFKNV